MLEEELIRREKDVGGKLHTARSRNDQIALDERLYLREEIQRLLGLVRILQLAFLEIAEARKEVILPGCI